MLRWMAGYDERLRELLACDAVIACAGTAAASPTGLGIRPDTSAAGEPFGAT